MITDFLKTSRRKEELKIALDILLEFKKCESIEEWAMIPFVSWTKLEQLEEFLDYLVNGTDLNDDTKKYLASIENNR